MVQIYTRHDVLLREACILKLQQLTNDGGLRELDVEFQFPPKILSDNRKGSWVEGELRGSEPIAVFKTSGPRDITFSWSYIVDRDGDENTKFSTAFIAKQVKLVRGYFASVRAIKERQRNLVVKFKYILFGGTNIMTCRIKSINVKHSDTIICPGNNINNSYPLKTDIIIDLRLWTKGGADKDQTQLLESLRDKLNPEWY